MKARKKNTAVFEKGGETGIHDTNSLSLAQAINADFDAFCSRVFPGEFAEPEDQVILRAVWWASHRQATARVNETVCKPLDAVARAQFELLVPPKTPVAA
jgi:hypothetical protein